MSQVHKENLTAVDNALPNRAGLDIEIFGMEGIPEDVTQLHNQRVLTSFHQTQADRQAATGNAASGAAGGNVAKKPKLEATSDLKKRLAEHKAAKLAAEQGEGRSSGGNTPQPAAPGQTAGSNGFVSTPLPIFITNINKYHRPRLRHIHSSNPTPHLLPTARIASHLRTLPLHLLASTSSLHTVLQQLLLNRSTGSLRQLHRIPSISPMLSPHSHPFSSRHSPRIRLRQPFHLLHIRVSLRTPAHMLRTALVHSMANLESRRVPSVQCLPILLSLNMCHRRHPTISRSRCEQEV